MKRITGLLLACVLMLSGVQPVWADAEIPNVEVQDLTAASTAEKLEISPAQTVTVGTTVTLSGTASSPEAANAVYRYIYYDGITWREIYRSDKVESVEWKPENTGTYLVAFQVQCGGQETNAFQSLNVTDNYFDFSGIRTAARSAGGIDIYPQYEASQGNAVSFTYMIYDLAAQAWYMLQENGGASCTWHPSAPGDYWIHVIGRDAAGNEIIKTIGYQVAGARVSGISMDKNATQTWNTTVVLTGSVDNPLNQQLTYEYLVYDGTYWKSLSKGPTLHSIEYRADGPGNYLLCFQAYDENGAVIGQSFMGYTAEASRLNIQGADTTLSPDGATVTIMPRYDTNQSENISFTYMIYDLQTQKWHMLQENGGTSCEWKLWAAGSYWIHIVGKTADGVETTYTMGYSVQGGAKVTGLQVVRKEGQQWDSGAILTGTVENPFGQQLEYEYLAYDGAYWDRVSRDSVLEAAEFIPKKPGTYLLCFQAYDESGAVIGQSFCGYSTEEPYINIGNIQAESVKEKEIHVSLQNIETNDGQAEYRWMYYDLSKQTWGLIQDWSEKTEAVWYPERFGSYWIHAEARTSSGKTVTATIGYSVIDFYVKLTEMQVYTPDFTTYYIQQNVDSNDPNLQYKYEIYDTRTSQWSLLPAGGGSNTYWQPQISGGYWIHATVTDSSGESYTNTIGYNIKGYRINSLDVVGNLEAGREAQLSLNGTQYLNESYTFTYYQWGGSGWYQFKQSDSADPIGWTPYAQGDYAIMCQVTNQYGILVDQIDIHIYPEDFEKNGWYYENGYKVYYIDGEKQLDLDGILAPQSSYALQVNRQTGTVTILAQDGNNGYIIPVKRFACSVGVSSTPTPTGVFQTGDKERWHTNTSGQSGQYATRITGNIWFLSVEGDGQTSFNVDSQKYNSLGSAASTGNVTLSVADAKWIYDNCPSGMQVTIYDNADPGPLGRGEVTLITDSNQNWDPTDSGAIYAAPFDSHAKEVMHNVIYAVETGGQIYGNARYDDFTEPYTNSSRETAITIGAGAWFATEAKNLLTRIQQADPALFQRLDTAGIANDLANANWNTYGTDGNGNITITEGSAKAVCIQNIISSDVGKRIQDQLVDEQMERYVNQAAALGVTDLKAKMFCANIEHLGGYSAMSWVVQVCQEDGLPMTMDNLYRAMRAHNSNPNGVGAPLYSTRHIKVMQWINAYIKSQ